MPTHAKKQPLSRLRRVLLGLDVAFSFILVALILGSEDPPLDLETVLSERFPTARSDAFHALNRLILPFSAWTVCWVGVGVGLVIMRRYDPLIPLCCGPVLGAVLAFAATNQSDPAWFTIGAVISIGFLVGIAVSIFWSFAVDRHSFTFGRPDRIGSESPQPR